MPEGKFHNERSILRVLEDNWFNSDNDVALQCAHLLKTALNDDESNPMDNAGEDGLMARSKCRPPLGLCLEGSDKDDRTLFQVLYHCWNGLGWTIAEHFKLPEVDDRIKEARLIGPRGPIHSNAIDVKISYVSPKTLVPRHSEESSEMLQILEGDQIQMGLAVDDWIERQKYNFFPPTQPKVVKTNDNHFVMISVHFGKVGGKLWLNDEDSDVNEKYGDIADIKEQGLDHLEKYYDNVAKDYDRAMRNWGYCMPELLTNVILDQTELKPCQETKVVDLGCGDGAIGEALHKKGFTNLVGADISNGMIDVARKRGVYTAFKKANLLQPLPFEENQFDCAISSAVTTYLDCSALKYWIPIVKKGGLLVIVHKASVWPKWEDEHDRLERDEVWKLVWMTKDPVPYLPSIECTGTNKARIYIYEKL